jgi:hypothetical protein
MRHSLCGAFALAAALSAAPALADALPMDTPVSTDGIESVCTGVGSAKDDPRWQDYPVRIEFSNAGAQYLSNVHVTISRDGRTLAAFECMGPWVLTRLPPGTYKATATLLDHPHVPPHSAVFETSGEGPQKRVEIAFPRISPNS